MQLFISQPDKGRKASNRFKELEKRIGGSTEAMEGIAEIIASRNRAAFGKGVTLQPATVEYKQKYGQSQEPLVETGRMKDELTSPERGTKRLRSVELIWGSNSLVEKGGASIPLAKAHLLQHGSKHQRKHKVLKVTPATRALIAKALMEYVTKD